MIVGLDAMHLHHGDHELLTNQYLSEQTWFRGGCCGRNGELRLDSLVRDESIPKRQDQAPTEPFLRFVDGNERVLTDE